MIFTQVSIYKVQRFLLYIYLIIEKLNSIEIFAAKWLFFLEIADQYMD